MNHPTLYSKRWLWWHDLHPAPDPRRGVLLWILGVGGPPGSPNLTPFQTQKCRFPHSFSDQISKIHTHFQTWPNLACSRLSISRGDSQFLPALFSCSRFLNSADPTIHRRTGYFLPGRAVNHLPKKFLQVAQIFTKQSNRNESRCNKIDRTGIWKWLHTVFQGQYLPSLSINYVAINKHLEKLPPQVY